MIFGSTPFTDGFSLDPNFAYFETLRFNMFYVHFFKFRTF